MNSYGTWGPGVMSSTTQLIPAAQQEGAIDLKIVNIKHTHVVMGLSQEEAVIMAAVSGLWTQKGKIKPPV